MGKKTKNISKMKRKTKHIKNNINDEKNRMKDEEKEDGEETLDDRSSSMRNKMNNKKKKKEGRSTNNKEKEEEEEEENSTDSADDDNSTSSSDEDKADDASCDDDDDNVDKNDDGQDDDEEYEEGEKELQQQQQDVACNDDDDGDSDDVSDDEDDDDMDDDHDEDAVINDNINKKTETDNDQDHDQHSKSTKKKNNADNENDKKEASIVAESKIMKNGESNNNNNNFFANDNFDSLPFSDKTLTALSALNYSRMTLIQSQSIPHLLGGKDLIGSAKTGSGKTLAFVLPAIELLYNASYTTRNGTGCIIITPTRELAIQIYGVIQELYQHSKHSQTYGLIMGGANRRTESERLTKGVNLLVSTPGRLLDHLLNTKGFRYHNLIALIIDEADRILEQGFEDDLRSILKVLPKQRQTMLFSATQTKKVDDLVRLSINPKNSIFIEISPTTSSTITNITGHSGNNNTNISSGHNNNNEQQAMATVSGLEQGYVSCASEQRFLLLFTFLKKNKKKKIMVFFSSCNSVKFHAELLNYIDIPVLDIHGKQKQIKRTTTFFTFCKQQTGILLCTDVAARGLDIPNVDWIIQYDPPDDPTEYIHRVGRTARGAHGIGKALMFLLPQEVGFLRYLKSTTKVNLSEYEFPANKIAKIQSQLYKLIETNYYLNRSARDGYRSYLLAYASHSHRNIFNVHDLDLQSVGAAFGFRVPPRIDLGILSHRGKSNASVSGRRKRKHHGGGNSSSNEGDDYNAAAAASNKKAMMIRKRSSSGHSFSASNPYGKRDTKDQRQFSH